MPLVEVATAPDVRSPEHAKQTASSLGQLLRDTRKVRRGLGSIRQDLNVSIACGDRVEIKGCQDLDWIPRIIRLEMARQLHFYRLANELRKEASLPSLPPNRSEDAIPTENRVQLAATNRIPLEINDLTEALSNCESEMIRKSVNEGATVLGVALPGLAGKLGTKQLDQDGAQLPRLEESWPVLLDWPVWRGFSTPTNSPHTGFLMQMSQPSAPLSLWGIATPSLYAQPRHGSQSWPWNRS